MDVQRVLFGLAEQLRTWWPVPGIAISVVDGTGESAFVTAGFANAESAAPVSRRTRFEIGSISKTFTAFLLGILADEGKVDLDAAVADHLPAEINAKYVGKVPGFRVVARAHNAAQAL
ncbi:serine hydrolase, partial [Streptomyces sp. NPDC001940]